MVLLEKEDREKLFQKNLAKMSEKLTRMSDGTEFSGNEMKKRNISLGLWLLLMLLIVIVVIAPGMNESLEEKSEGKIIVEWVDENISVVKENMSLLNESNNLTSGIRENIEKSDEVIEIVEEIKVKEIVEVPENLLEKASPKEENLLEKASPKENFSLEKKTSEKEKIGVREVAVIEEEGILEESKFDTTDLGTLLIKSTGEKTLHLQKFQGLEKWLIQEKQWSKDNENIYINLTINTTVYNFIKDAYQNPTMAKCLKAEPYIKEDYPNFACSNAAHRQLALTKFENFVTKGFKIVKQGVEQGYISLIGNKVYIVVPLSSISLNNSIEIGESSLVYVYKEVLTVNYQSFNLDLNTTLERCDKNRENCGVAYPNVSIINSSNLKFGAEDTEVNENTNYRYVFKSNLRIKESGNNKFLLNHKYLGKTGEGLNSYENVFLNIQDICDVTGNFDPNCEYLINDSYDYEIENTTEIICNEYNENGTCIKNETIENINTIPIFKFSTLDVYFTGEYNLTKDRIFIDPFYHTNGSAILQTDFYSTWNTSKVAGNKNVTLPLESGGTYDFKAYWGDGTNSSITAWNDVDKKHDYTTAGVYNITLSGTIVGFRFNNGLDKLKIIDIKQWGQLRLGNSNAYFYGASNLNVTATDILNLTGTTTLANMFRSASVFNQNIGKWNTSKVTSMASMFWSASKFNNSGNGSINNWDTHNVTSMADMFRSTVFNQNIGSWNT